MKTRPYHVTDAGAPALALGLDAVRSDRRIVGRHDDARLERLIRAAVEHVETVTGLALVQRAFVLHLDGGFPDRFVVPRSPLVSVEGVTYLDTNGDEQTLSPSAYRVVTGRVHGEILRVSGATWPATLGEADDVRVEFVAGYADIASEADPDAATERAKIPARALQAVSVLAGTWYEHAEDVVVGTIAGPVPGMVGRMLAPLRTWYAGHPA